MGEINRIRIEIEGIVQGIGFRPFIYRLATKYGLAGWVMNTPSGLVMEAQGTRKDLDDFTRAIPEEAPPLSSISYIGVKEAIPVEATGFVIRPSGGNGSEVQIAPDGDVCAACLEELFTPENRRYRYPFINCTDCGPRYTIINAVPYDRALTTMVAFEMCAQCRAEYEDPANRRFHAQPNACPACGPRLTLTDRGGRVMEGDPLETAIELLRRGKILAIKGLGGYHFAVDACQDLAVQELRKRKRRDQKPFAIMSPDLEAVAEYAEVEETERKLLCGPERPIVLLRKHGTNPIARNVAPTNGYFGVMLPYTPLHHLLVRDNFTALVMTSGNLGTEPICISDQEAFRRLGSIADYFLTHNRDICTRADDSVLRVFRGRPVFLRRSRGYAPRMIALPALDKNVLAVGAELKSVVCLAQGKRAFLSQHIGDLLNPETLSSLENTIAHLQGLLRIEPEVVAHDLHPQYLSTGYAEKMKYLPRIAVQHHHAHMASCMAENGLEGDVIGVIFDGSGYGEDGTVWGGEFLLGGYCHVERKGHLRQVVLPGGNAAAQEPYRMALSYLYDAVGEELFYLPLSCVRKLSAEEQRLFLKMLQNHVNSPFTSSCGRLFDAVAALIGLRGKISYEGQAAMELEGFAEAGKSTASYPFEIRAPGGKYVSDFRQTIRNIVKDVGSGAPVSEIAKTFHNTLAAAVGETCRLIREETGVERVVLSGGVFQNRLLTEAVHRLLVAADFRVFTHRLVPPNDGGIALGQAMVAGRICKGLDA